MAKKNKESYVMSIRLDKETYQRLNQISNETNIKKSKLLKSSFNEWINLKKIFLKSNSVIVGKNLLKSLFEFATLDNLKELSQTIAENWLNKINIRLIDMRIKRDLDSMLSTFSEGIGPNEANWFDEINYQTLDNGNVLIYGIHSLNKNFSIFFKFFLEYLMKKQFNQITVEDSSNISDTTVELEFKFTDKI